MCKWAAGNQTWIADVHEWYIRSGSLASQATPSFFNVARELFSRATLNKLGVAWLARLRSGAVYDNIIMMHLRN